MAVHAQHPSTVAFSPADFCNWAGNYAIEELGMAQDQRNMHGLHIGGAGVNNGKVFSDPQSALTYNNASGNLPREELPLALQQPAAGAPVVVRFPSLAPPALAPSSSGVRQSRLPESGGTSTSGRVPSPLSRDVAALFLNQKEDIDALVRQQSEQVRCGLKEAWKQHGRLLLQTVEQRAAKGLRAKEAELEKELLRTVELEEKVRQAMAENAMWSVAAKNNEAVVASLQARLEEALFRRAAAQPQEGFGDSEEVSRNAPAAAPAMQELDRRGWLGTCRECGQGDACVLVLPCRHLSLCTDCAPTVDMCPFCGTEKRNWIRVNMS